MSLDLSGAARLASSQLGGKGETSSAGSFAASMVQMLRIPIARNEAGAYPPCAFTAELPNPVCAVKKIKFFNPLRIFAFMTAVFPTGKYRFYLVDGVYPNGNRSQQNDTSVLGQIALQKANLTQPRFILHGGRSPYIPGFIAPLKIYQLYIRYNYKVLQPQLVLDWETMFPRRLLKFCLLSLCFGLSLLLLMRTCRNTLLYDIVKLILMLEANIFAFTLQGQGHLAILFTFDGVKEHPLASFKVHIVLRRQEI